MARRRKIAPRRATSSAGAPTPPASGRSRAWLAAAVAALLAAGVWLATHRRTAHPNLLLVTIDTLRADHVGAYGSAEARTPTLDGLARRGARFASAHATVPLTGPSHATILTGQYPPVHGVRDNVTFVLDARRPTLATLLKAAGYQTGAFIGAYPLAKDFGFGEGFDQFDEALHPSALSAQGAERPGNEVADAAIAWLAGRQAPFFAWVHLYDPHAPYTPPAPFDASFRDRPYDGEIAFADAQVGRVLDALRAAGHGDDTVVAVLSDHGEGLGDHGEAEHGLLLYESTLHVPLIVAGPGVPGSTVVDAPVGTVELLPTLAGLLGVASPAGLPGRDLRPAWRGERLAEEALYAETLFGRLNCRWAALRALTRGPWKLVTGGATELFDLQADPGERQNRLGTEADRARRLGDTLDAALKTMAPAGDRATARAITAEQEERLRSLGYAAGGGGAGGLDDAGLPDPRTHVQMFDRLQAATLARGPAQRAQALEDVRAIAASDAGNPYAQFTLATLAYEQGAFAVAAAAYARALELDPDRPTTRTNYARLLRETNHFAEAERQYRIALTQAADDTHSRVGLAETLVAAGRLDAALAELTPILAREPHHTEAHRAYGRLLIARSQPREAVAHFEQAARGRDPEPWIELGAAYLAVGDARKAEEAAGQALARSPAHPWALAIEAHALAVQGRRDEALGLLHRALVVKPRRAEVWKALAAAFDAAGDARAAAACRREAAG